MVKTTKLPNIDLTGVESMHFEVHNETPYQLRTQVEVKREGDIVIFKVKFRPKNEA